MPDKFRLNTANIVLLQQMATLCACSNQLMRRQRMCLLSDHRIQKHLPPPSPGGRRRGGLAESRPVGRLHHLGRARRHDAGQAFVFEKLRF